MSAFIGNTQPNNYYIGNTPLSALYVGSNKIWPVGQEVAHFDFGNTTSFATSSSLSVLNISPNRNYIAGNITQYNLTNYTSGTPPIGRQDPSGSGTFLPFTASSAGTALYLANSGQLYAHTSSAFTFETWIRPYNKKADGNTWLIGPGHNEIFGNYGAWDFGINSANVNDGRMNVMHRSPITSLVQSSSTAPNTVDIGQWNHLVYTLQRNSDTTTTFTMYKNGVLQPIVSSNSTANGFSTNANSIFGVNSILGNNRFGLYDMSQFRFYNKVLDASEVVALFQATRARYSI